MIEKDEFVKLKLREKDELKPLIYEINRLIEKVKK